MQKSSPTRFQAIAAYAAAHAYFSAITVFALLYV
jgi:hypothetical protein